MNDLASREPTRIVGKSRAFCRRVETVLGWLLKSPRRPSANKGENPAPRGVFSI
jgi:hypothetical protein